MKLRTLCSALAAAGVLGLADAPAAAAQRGGGTLRPFGSEREFLEFARRLEREQRRRDRNRPPPPPPPPPPAPPPPVPAPMPGVPAEPAAAVTGTGAAGESITNVQTAGVDEGGIVKTHGNHLVILRRGRLFTVRVGGGSLEPVSSSDAFGPGIDPDGAWYDELLVADSLVAVIGYSYARGGTEVGLFRIDDAGRLAHRATYQLRSGDYYSSRNYASRLVAGKLVFYAPIPYHARDEDPFSSFPAVRRWGAADSSFRRTASFTRVYRPAGELSLDDRLMLHTVTVCDPRPEMRCESTSLLGPWGREFYVSGGSVYVWATQLPAWDAREDERPRSTVYRMPLDGSAPTAARVAGRPVDQFSFLESGDAHLQVLVRDDGRRPAAGLSLLRVPLSLLGDGAAAAPPSAYRRLPAPAPGPLQNRYVGDWLLYGAGAGWGAPPGDTSRAFAVRWAGRDDATPLPLPHSVERIEAMGTGAVLVGTDGSNLHFSGVRLGGAATLADRYTRAGAAQGESRSQGFFYRPESADAGVLGLPIRSASDPRYAHLRRGSASVLFLRNRDFRLAELGDLAARPDAVDDGCVVSCVDWYGNARPIFLGGRILALMGYEVVEGAEEGGRIRERRRVSFAPPPASVAGVWEYDESVGAEGDRYHCRSRGVYRVTQNGAALGVEYDQTGDCTAEGRKQDNAARGSGTGTATAGRVTFRFPGCEPTARLVAPDRLHGTYVCPVQLPSGERYVAYGRWTARRR